MAGEPFNPMDDDVQDAMAALDREIHSLIGDFKEETGCSNQFVVEMIDSLIRDRYEN